MEYKKLSGDLKKVDKVLRGIDSHCLFPRVGKYRGTFIILREGGEYIQVARGGDRSRILNAFELV